jgi:hypothetical protein
MIKLWSAAASAARRRFSMYYPKFKVAIQSAAGGGALQKSGQCTRLLTKWQQSCILTPFRVADFSDG